jgi:hypothetical protein
MTVIILENRPWKVTHTVILADTHLQHLSILRRYSEFSEDEVDDRFVKNQDGYTAFYRKELPIIPFPTMELPLRRIKDF